MNKLDRTRRIALGLVFALVCGSTSLGCIAKLALSPDSMRFRGSTRKELAVQLKSLLERARIPKVVLAEVDEDRFRYTFARASVGPWYAVTTQPISVEIAFADVGRVDVYENADASVYHKSGRELGQIGFREIADAVLFANLVMEGQRP